MPYLSCGSERHALRPGENSLGGNATDALPFPLLPREAPVAKISIYPDGSAAIQRVAPRAVVRLNKRLVGLTPRILRHGARIDVGRCRLAYDATPTSDDDGKTASLSPAPVAAPVTQVSAAPTLMLPSVAAGVRHPAASPLPPAPLGTLEVVRGKLAGRRWQVERAVTTLGRGEDCDLRIVDESVSSTHATLLRKGEDWFVVDLRSSNGTFVDGYRIAGERALVQGSMLRLGNVELLFRTLVARTPSTNGTQHLSGLAERFSKLW